MAAGSIAGGSLRMARTAETPAEVSPAARVLWTNTRLVGSPDPPLPYTVEPALAKVEWKSPIFAVEQPDADALWVVAAGGGTDKPSRILRVVNDAEASATSAVFELPGRLLYAVCFDPRYRENRFVYVFSNGPTAKPERINRVARFRATDGEAPTLDPASELAIVEWPSSGHDGGDLVFGLDGMLYITTGDGSSDSDTFNSGQTLDDLLGAVLRIDVRHATSEQPYKIPADNPFVSRPEARGEIWAYGLRNPWRMCVDRRTGHLWVGNNGQDLWETAHLVRRGENYGWSVMEGSHPFYLERQLGPTPPVKPTIEHSHAEFRSLTGGVVYEGQKLAELQGAYVYGDYSSGRIWGMKHDGQRVVWHRELADTALQIAGFAVDRRGELLVVDHGSGLYRLTPAKVAADQTPFPTRLSETGLFADTPGQRPASGVIAYSVNLPGWNDGARAQRWLALPGEGKITYDASKSWTFPDGTAIVQTLTSPRDSTATGQERALETRVLLRQQGEWAGYSYVWNDEQSDAVLAPREGTELQLKSHLVASEETAQAGTWRVPSRVECMTCHSRAANYVLGLCESQINRVADYAGGASQLATWANWKLFSNELPKPVGECSKLPNAYDESVDLEQRVRAYLHVNCSMCHVAAGGGNAQMELLFTQPRDGMRLLGARPQHDTFGVDNAMLVAPGEPERSVIVRRLERRGRGQMPPLFSRQVDTAAVDLMRRWIAQLKPARPIVRRWTVADLADAVADASSPRSLENGKKVFEEIGCAQCHRFQGGLGTVGPDLTSIGNRPAREVLESVVEPSKQIADAFASYLIQTTDGVSVSGRIEFEDERRLLLRTFDAASGESTTREIAVEQVEARRKLDVSNMPSGTIDVLSESEVLDLVAYLRSGAK